MFSSLKSSGTLLGTLPFKLSGRNHKSYLGINFNCLFLFNSGKIFNEGSSFLVWSKTQRNR